MPGPDQPPALTSAADALGILDLLTTAGADTWVGGGWGVDALLGSQTREHRDLDVLIPHPRSIAVYEALRSAGFVITTDWFPVRFEMIDGVGSVADVHPIRLHEDGTAELELPDGSRWTYEREALAGRGSIAGERVRCLSVEEQVRTHLGYEPTATEMADMSHLAEQFALDLPAPYR